MAPETLRGAVVGAGYFSQFQLEAWGRIPEVTLAAIADPDRDRAQTRMDAAGIERYYADFRTLIDAEQLDFVDIITPPATHHEIAAYAADRGVHVICQKPLAPTYAESKALVDAVLARGVRFMAHENWRWQPWYREIRRLIDEDVLGEVTMANFRLRTGDGWGHDAYLSRQPFFRDYKRLLIYETGVHFIDAFRFLFGEIDTLWARLRRLNPVIQGEDCGQVFFTFENGVVALFDANRYNESEAANPRYTFGDLRIDGSKGHLDLDSDGRLWFKPLGEARREHRYPHTDEGFGGDCVYALQRHFVDCMLSGAEFESNGPDYLRTVAAVDAIYAAAQSGQSLSYAAFLRELAGAEL